VSWICAEYLYVFYESFKSTFEVLHPQTLNPIHFASFELQNTNICITISPRVMLIIEHQNHLVKRIEVHFPYRKKWDALEGKVNQDF
jgi:hypothetical protein